MWDFIETQYAANVEEKDHNLLQTSTNFNSTMVNVIVKDSIIISIITHLYTIHHRIVKEKSATLNMNVVIGITNKLRNSGKPMDPNHVIGEIINSLSAEYAPSTIDWQGTSIVEMTIETL